MVVHSEQVQLFLVFLVIAKAASQPIKPDCQTSCGNLNIPYPFGTTKDCYLDDTFLINCSHDSIPFLGSQNHITVLNISLDGELHVSSPIIHDCYGTQGNDISTNKEKVGGLNLTHFSISSNRNKFTTLGCDTVGMFLGYDRNKKHTTTIGCVSICSTLGGTISNGSCDGTGCCQIHIPDGLYGFEMETWSRNNHSTVDDFNPCNYAFVVEEGAYKFLFTDLKNLENKNLPLVLDWDVGKQRCQEAQNLPSYACKANKSDCYDTNGIGYRCKCHKGFEGNPYLLDGCHGNSIYIVTY